MNTPNLAERMATKSDGDLIDMLVRSDDWTPEAKEAARAELEKRNVDMSAVEATVAEASALLPPTNRPFSQDEVFRVAKWQKAIIWMILLSAVALFIPWASLAAGLIQLYFIFQLARAVRSSIPWLYILLAFIPLAGLLGVLHLNGKATRILRENGIKVGLMGARPKEMPPSTKRLPV